MKNVYFVCEKGEKEKEKIKKKKLKEKKEKCEVVKK